MKNEASYLKEWVLKTRGDRPSHSHSLRLHAMSHLGAVNNTLSIYLPAYSASVIPSDSTLSVLYISAALSKRMLSLIAWIHFTNVLLLWKNKTTSKPLSPHIKIPSICVITDNPKESSQVPVFIKVLDVNDNAPEFVMFYETFVCENAKAEQVSSLCFERNKYLMFCAFCVARNCQQQ